MNPLQKLKMMAAGGGAVQL